MAAGCEAGSWDAIGENWTLARYNKMHDIWEEHGPPPFISLKAAFASPKGRGKKGSPADDKPDKDVGTMEDLARVMGGVSPGSKARF